MGRSLHPPNLIPPGWTSKVLGPSSVSGHTQGPVLLSEHLGQRLSAGFPGLPRGGSLTRAVAGQSGGPGFRGSRRETGLVPGARRGVHGWLWGLAKSTQLGPTSCPSDSMRYSSKRS